MQMQALLARRAWQAWQARQALQVSQDLLEPQARRDCKAWLVRREQSAPKAHRARRACREWPASQDQREARQPSTVLR